MNKPTPNQWSSRFRNKADECERCQHPATKRMRTPFGIERLCEVCAIEMLAHIQREIGAGTKIGRMLRDSAATAIFALLFAVSMWAMIGGLRMWGLG